MDVIGAAAATSSTNPIVGWLFFIGIGITVLAIIITSRRRKKVSGRQLPPSGSPSNGDQANRLASPRIELSAREPSYLLAPPREIHREFRVGSRIAGYRLEGQIGRGGMAVVFSARDVQLQRLVALKILAPNLMEDEAFRRRFVRESRAAAAVDDPHIIPVFQAGEADGILFIAMRYVPGGSVRDKLKGHGALSFARTVAIVSPVASALDAAHAAGLVHRDVKPANMLLDVRPGRHDHVYLSDFGISKGLASSIDLTGTGEFLGTLIYSAPEQIECAPVDGRTDEYALACTAFELLTGASPFQRGSNAAILHAKLSEPPPLLTAYRPDLPRATDQVFAQALAKAPRDRYTTCLEFSDALRRALLATSGNPSPRFRPAGGNP